MSTIIRVGNHTISIWSKSDIRNSNIQQILKLAHKDNQHLNCTCLCNPKTEHELLFDVRQRQGMYYIAKNKSRVKGHSQDCLYYEDRISNEDDDGRYTSSIFKPPKSYENSKKIQKISKESREFFTFTKLCLSLISISSIHAFHLRNKNAKNREQLRNPTESDFQKSLWVAMHKNTEIMTNDKTVFETLPKGSWLHTGVIEEDVFKDEVNTDEVFDIILPYETKDGRREKVATITGKRFNIARKHVLNLSNVISPPYFYFAVVGPNNKVVRMFIHPVHIEKGTLTFVESNNERKFTSRLLAKNSAFIKPIVGNEFRNLRRDLVTFDGKTAYLDLVYRPDFIILQPNNIWIVEVSGYKSKEYLETIRRKKAWFAVELKKPIYKNYIFHVEEY